MWDKSCRDRGSYGLWCRAEVDKGLQVSEGWSIFGFVGEHHCFKSGSSRAPLDACTEPGADRSLIPSGSRGSFFGFVGNRQFFKSDVGNYKMVA